jgi:bifunctional UDP-N-acetylglucosamine pyrophosphorylase/glucosamine-1-phosphate N-acetyltransferase
MKSEIPKVLHTLAGRSMIQYPVDLARAVGADPIVVIVGHHGDDVRESLKGDDLHFVTQEPQLGSGHALKCARDFLLDLQGEVLVLYGDVPFLMEATIRGMVHHHRTREVTLTVLVANLENPGAYGRILRDSQGQVVRVVEARDATEEQRKIREINTGTYCADPSALIEALDSLTNDNAQREYYLTDVVQILAPRGVVSHEISADEEFLGINDRVDLAQAEEIMQWRLRHHWMREGVTMRDPCTTYIDGGVQIGRDTILEPQVFLRGQTVIGEGCWIGAGCWIEDCVLEDAVKIQPSSVMKESHVAEGATIGPFAHLRPACYIGPGARIGNFVEVKKSTVGRGSKAAHLSYIGDAEIGTGVNIGAGTITCNYDGHAKHATVIEDDVFVGSDTQLIAPVRVGKGSVVGAGSTITKNVPPGSLAVSRARQVNLKKRPRRG